jgi:hypothetical protein
MGTRPGVARAPVLLCPTTIMMSAIPYDVVERILDWTNALQPDPQVNRTLRSAASVARVWTRRCQEHLFEYVYLNDYLSDAHLIYSRLAFLWTRPRLARLVRVVFLVHLDLPPAQIRAWIPLLFPRVTRLSVVHVGGSSNLRLLESPSLAASFRTLREMVLFEPAHVSTHAPAELIVPDMSAVRLQRLALTSRGGLLPLFARQLAASPSADSLRHLLFNCVTHEDLYAAAEIICACSHVQVTLDYSDCRLEYACESYLPDSCDGPGTHAPYLGRAAQSGFSIYVAAPCRSESLTSIQRLLALVGDKPGRHRARIRFDDVVSSTIHQPFEGLTNGDTSPVIPSALASQLEAVHLLFPLHLEGIEGEQVFERLLGPTELLLLPVVTRRSARRSKFSRLLRAEELANALASRDPIHYPDPGYGNGMAMRA